MATRACWGVPPGEGGETTLLLVRHGETLWNREGRVQGQADSPLSERGLLQGERIARRLAGRRLDAVYSSDSRRAVATAELLARPHGLAVLMREDLRERCYGVLEGKTLEEAAQQEGAWFLEWQANRERAPRAGESQDELCRRLLRALQEILVAHPGQRVALATHGGPIKSAIYGILQISLSLWRATWIENGSLTVLRGTPGSLRIASFNDICHLESPCADSTQVAGG